MACWLFRLPRLPCLSYKAMERSGGKDIVEFCQYDADIQ